MGMKIPENTWTTLGSVMIDVDRYEIVKHDQSGQLGLIHYLGISKDTFEEGVDVELMTSAALLEVAEKVFRVYIED